MSVDTLANLFLLLSALMGIAGIALFARYLEGRARVIAASTFLGWWL